MMKTLKIAILTLGVVALISCNNRNTRDTTDTDATTDAYGQTTTDGYGQTADRTQNTGTETLNTDNSANSINSRLNTQDMTGMYRDLNMTQDQIDRFQNDYTQKQNVRSSDNIQDVNHVDLQMDESLKAVLSTEQYNKYQEWKKQHPRE